MTGVQMIGGLLLMVLNAVVGLTAFRAVKENELLNERKRR